MYARATTTISTYRATTVSATVDTTNIYPDVSDSNVNAVLCGQPASILERTVSVMPGDSSTPDVIRYLVGRVTSGSDVQADDRVIDDNTGAVFVVDSLTRSSSVVNAPDLQFQLRLLDQG